MDYIRIIEITLVITGTVLWFIGPVFSRKPLENAMRVYKQKPPEQLIAGDASENVTTDKLQIIGVALIIDGLLINDINYIYLIIISILVLLSLWFIRTCFYYNRWITFENKEIEARKWKRIYAYLEYRNTLIVMFFSPKKAMELTR